VKSLFDQPEYLHVLVNPVLTHALPFAALGLLIALVGRSRAGARLALVLIALTSAAVWPAAHYGNLGFDRVKSMADETGSEWLDAHRDRAEDSEWVFYAAAALALVALLAPLVWPKSTALLSWLALVAAVAACVVAAWVAWPAGKVRHREFRHGPPPAAEARTVK
jgi:hypothetical protein